MFTAPHSVLSDLLRPLGCYDIRANRLTCLSSAYLLDPPCVTDLRPTKILITAPNAHLHSPGTQRSRYPPTPISHLPGTGPYALDSYRIFCIQESDEWKRVMPSDKELVRFLVSFLALTLALRLAECALCPRSGGSGLCTRGSSGYLTLVSFAIFVRTTFEN